MKIGIISSGIESLSLFKFLNRYEHEYVLYLDTLHAPYGEKYFATSLEKVKAGVEFLRSQGVEKIIVPPVHELALLQEGESQILPLFQTYLLHEVLPFSLVGKIGLLGETEELHNAQELFENLEKNYSPTPAQKAMKAFSFPFHYRSKACGLARQLLTHLSRKSFLTNTVLKQELRYFKDANVDTLIPLNYCLFNGEKTIKKFLNFKKIRFHTLEKLEKSFKSMIPEGKSAYQVSIYATDSKQALIGEKKWLWILQRGKEISINWLEKVIKK